MYGRLFDALREHLDLIYVVRPESPADLAARMLLQQADDVLQLRHDPDERFLGQFGPRLDALESMYRKKVGNGSSSGGRAAKAQ